MRAEEWESLDEETKFQRTNEDIFKEPCIHMQNTVQIKQIEQLQAKLAELGERNDENAA